MKGRMQTHRFTNCNRMGLCLDTSDCNLQIIGLSVVHFRGYPETWEGLSIR